MENTESISIQCKEHCKIAINAMGKIHECHSNGCVIHRIETNKLNVDFTEAQLTAMNKKGWYSKDQIQSLCWEIFVLGYSGYINSDFW